MLDYLDVVVELVDGSLLEKFSEIERLEKQISEKILSVLGLRV